jgi:surface polysaccharide O-acyltransferase-like enzyme
LEDGGVDSSKRIAIPDVLIRTLAITLVIVLHVSNEALQSNAIATTYWWTGAVYKTLALSCVPLFVMLSGALLLQPAKLNEPIRVFLKKRLSRIGLAFAFWTTVYIAWSFYVTQFPITLENVGQSVLKSLFTGAYYQFWFIYLIVGLYLITPILRVIIAKDNLRIIRYLILLWFVGVGVVPLLQLASGHVLDSTVFVLGGWVGYFVLGVYLQKLKLRSAVLYGLLILAFVWTMFGIWLMNYPFNGLLFNGIVQNFFFFDYLTANVIAGSAALFMLLIKFHPDWPGSNPNPTVLKRVVQVISKNTLPIFLFHVIILECFQRGYFGFTLTSATLNPIIEIPLTATLTLFLTLSLILLMRKVPFLKKLIG